MVSLSAASLLSLSTSFRSAFSLDSLNIDQPYRRALKKSTTESRQNQADRYMSQRKGTKSKKLSNAQFKSREVHA
jgi:hypothetical protein